MDLESANPSWTIITDDISAPQSTTTAVDLPVEKQDNTAVLQKNIFFILSVSKTKVAIFYLSARS